MSMSGSNNIPVFENFVSIPGIVQVQWRSDDPEFSREPKDLRTLQTEGIDANFGKKDRYSTVQGIFYCIVCDCEIKSVVTLRDHCKVREGGRTSASWQLGGVLVHVVTLFFHWQGTQHQRKECIEKAKLLKRYEVKKGDHRRIHEEEEEEVVMLEEEGEEDRKVYNAFRQEEDLGSLVERTGEPVVGLAHVTEVRATRGGDPMYTCGLRSCNEFSADARIMLRHLHELRHQRDYFNTEWGEAPATTDMEEEVRAEFRLRGSEVDGMKRLVDRGRHRRALLRESYSAVGYSVMRLGVTTEEEKEGGEGGGGDAGRERSRSPVRREQDTTGCVSPPPESKAMAAESALRSPAAVISPGQSSSSSTSELCPAEVAFNRVVAKVVMEVLNKYFFPNDKFPKKIRSDDDYKATARKLSHRLREQEKQSYLASRPSLEGIAMTPDMRNRMELLVDMDMEKLPELEQRL